MWVDAHKATIYQYFQKSKFIFRAKIQPRKNLPKRSFMANYMIHTYPKRLWFVEDYIIPSMLEQGISRDNIRIHNDIDGEGNLRACMHSFMEVDDNDEGTWHIQDDVCICKDFKERTEWYDNGVVCGFSSALYDGPGKVGAVRLDKMWFSFPCIRIPNQYARECSDWVFNYIIGNPIYKMYWQSGKNDDWAFRAYLGNYHKEDAVLNIAPNLVDHVDYLLGGGSGGLRKKEDAEKCRAQYWKDYDVVQALEKKLGWKGDR